MSNVTLGVELTIINCGECGGSYAINERYRETKHTSGGYWNCPYCKCSWGYGTSEIERVRKQLAAETAARERAQQRATELRASVEHERKRVQGYQGALTKVKKRVGKGTCPCCQRHFQNVQRHMATQHPEYATAPDTLTAKEEVSP